MNLSNFHVVLISTAICFAFGYAYWAFVQYQTDPRLLYVLTILGSIAIGIGFIFYLIWFFKKIKKTHQF